MDEVARGGREFVGHLVFGLADALECALDAGHLERRGAHQQRVEHHAERPDVRLEAVRLARRHLPTRSTRTLEA